MKQTVTLLAHLLPASLSPHIATVERWEKSLGQAVMIGDALVTLRAGGELFVVPSPAFGILAKKSVLAGEAIEAGEPVAVLGGVSAPLAPPVLEPFATPPAYVPAGPEEIYRLSPTELAVAEHHARALRDTPHTHLVTTADVSEASRYIARTGRGETVPGVPETLTLLPFMLCAVAASLTRFPELNAERTGDEEVRRKRYVHLGVETRDKNGILTVPVLRDVNRKSVLTVAREWEHLKMGIARQTLTSEDVSGATFIVSHTPTVLYRTSILHRPLAGHLCFGKTTGDQVYLCLACDAAIVNDETAETFLSDVADGLSDARFLFA
ncbi:MAG: 2-oxo acid dehydrogenase subunit E2 [Fibrella sp.]|nr:2-oxo acid dehydrogenase subunit E2 [Armatimonadota bacterium]